jgi:hypothetical protein
MTRADSAISATSSTSASRIGAGSRVVNADPRTRVRRSMRCCSRVRASTCTSGRLARGGPAAHGAGLAAGRFARVLPEPLPARCAYQKRRRHCVD